MKTYAYDLTRKTECNMYASSTVEQFEMPFTRSIPVTVLD